jgi:hypothetical protein
MCLKLLEFSKLNEKYIWRNKKVDPAWIVSQEEENKNDTIHIVICLFLFLLLYFEFSSEIFWECEHTPLWTPRNFFTIFLTIVNSDFQNDIMVLWYHVRHGITRYVLLTWLTKVQKEFSFFVTKNVFYFIYFKMYSCEVTTKHKFAAMAPKTLTMPL